MKFTGIILAAGASSRMGRPKALLPWAGESFVDRLIGVFTAATDRPPVVVLGYHADAIRSAAQRACLFAVNPDPDRGMLSSLQCGVAALPADTDAFLFSPVDYPSFAPSTVTALIDALAGDPDAMFAIPRHEGKRGHPIACCASLAKEFLALPPTAQARDVVHAHVGQTIYIDTLDAGIHHDVDRPEDYERLLATVSRA